MHANYRNGRVRFVVNLNNTYAKLSTSQKPVGSILERVAIDNLSTIYYNADLFA